MDAAAREKAMEKQTARHDAIRVENIRKERKYAREWAKRWGFLAEGEERDSVLHAICQGEPNLCEYFFFF